MCNCVFLECEDVTEIQQQITKVKATGPHDGEYWEMNLQSTTTRVKKYRRKHIDEHQKE